MRAIEKAWFDGSKWVWLLAPLSLLFFLISSIRRALFRLGIKASGKPNVPVIVVGNISVGGNGKTPTVLALCEFLVSQGYTPGIVSRGYGAKCKTFPHLITSKDHSEFVGDEPFLMFQRLKMPVVIDPVRRRGAKYLTEQCACNIIVCDDGLQHYALERDIELVIIDGERRHGNGYLLPMGPLREGPWRLSSVDAVLVNGGEARAGEFPMHLQAGDLVNINHGEHRLPVSQVSDSVLAFAGIGNPQRFFTTLEQNQIDVETQLSFPDHHHFQPTDIPHFDGMVIMTEKDAVKCREFAKDNWWYLPVEGKLPDTFFDHLSQKLRKISA
ncbi:tetraacyldisaccharide 4'-kinase [Alteromonas sp. a30]|uniref:tetraacyldisaccharide 4'-kinase n=1 Tax=Alteromonas sp. a30 TaxID=2730917 RepID=UPI0022815C9F|nr:tetraacyldisaccharide 4'-kinase [Alteromonas sp. a30]MCY7293941.1 tetraacyldisaccharide 4'-kinase [Alteromonas sp. a30]